jgi:GPH family glycoside/pentoside/hexuronide:cation symporter
MASPGLCSAPGFCAIVAANQIIERIFVEQKLGWSTLAAIAAPAVPMAALTLPLVTYVPEHYANALGLNLATVGLIFMIVRLLDIGFDPVVGALMDKTRTRWGRFRPWILGGIPLVMLGTGMLFFAQPGVGPLYLTISLIIIYAGYSIVTLAQLALAASMSKSYDMRSRIFSWWQAATTGGILLVMLLPTVLGGKVPLGLVQIMGLSILITTPIGALIAVVGVKDTSLPPPAQRASFGEYFGLFRLESVRRIMTAELLLGLVGGIVSATGIMFIVAVKQLTLQEFGIQVLVYFSAAIISAPIWTIIARKIGKHQALILSSITFILFLTLSWFIPPGRLDLILAVSLVGGFSYTASSLLPRAMVADIADEEKLETGADRTGLLYALMIGIFKIGQAVSVGITFVALDWFGYVAKLGPQNDDGAILGVALVYIVLTAICAIGALLAMIGYPLTARRHAEIQEQLAHNERVAAGDAQRLAGDEAGGIAVKV